MHLNTLAERSYNDLMQYPVFPWILADYDSEEIDLTNPKSFRNFAKPMGAQSADRLEQFQKRYKVSSRGYHCGCVILIENLTLCVRNGTTHTMRHHPTITEHITVLP